MVALQQGDLGRAVERIGKAVAVRPGVPLYHCNLAEAYRLLGQPDRAVGCCRTALRLQPEYPEATNNLGLALQAQGKWEEASDQFHAAIRMKPNYAMAHNNLGNAFRERGDKGSAGSLSPGGPDRRQPGRKRIPISANCSWRCTS